MVNKINIISIVQVIIIILLLVFSATKAQQRKNIVTYNKHYDVLRTTGDHSEVYKYLNKN